MTPITLTSETRPPRCSLECFKLYNINVDSVALLLYSFTHLFSSRSNTSIVIWNDSFMGRVSGRGARRDQRHLCKTYRMTSFDPTFVTTRMPTCIAGTYGSCIRPIHLQAICHRRYMPKSIFTSVSHASHSSHVCAQPARHATGATPCFPTLN